jgi:SnoaL-like domain
MPRFTQETAVSAAEIEQLINEWGAVLDLDNCVGVTALCTDDCEYHVGGSVLTGHAAIDAFYAARNERVSTLQKDGIRTQRHTISGFRYTFHTSDHATVRFALVNYSKEGKPPALDLVGPTIVADCRMEFKRGADREWRISLFDSTPVFIGNDPFLNASVVKK